MCEPTREGVAATELRRSITCLALEVPAAVWDDVKAKADAVLAENEQLRARLLRDERFRTNFRVSD